MAAAMIDHVRWDYAEIDLVSAQVWGSLVGFCEGGPFETIDKGPRGPQAGLEALRRLYARYSPSGPHTARNVMAKIVTVKPVKIENLRSAIETLESWFDDYRCQAKAELQDDQKCIYLQSLLSEPLKSHIELVKADGRTTRR